MVPSTQLRSGDSPQRSTASRQRETTRFVGEHQMKHRSEQASLPMAALCRDIRCPQQMGGGDRQATPPRFVNGQPLESTSELLIGLIQSGNPVMPRRGLIDQIHRSSV